MLLKRKPQYALINNSFFSETINIVKFTNYFENGSYGNLQKFLDHQEASVINTGKIIFLN